MVTSSEFDKVLVPVDYQNNVLMRTFDNLIGFNKKNKKGKFMKAIKEEWENGKWVEKTTAQKEAEARHKAIQDKLNSGVMKIVSLDKKKKTEPKTTAEKKATEKKIYTGTLINKIGKTEAQIRKDLNDKISGKTKSKEKEPNDTHYTIDEIVDYAYAHSKSIREKFASDIAFKQALIKNEKLRKKLDEKIIAKIGHKLEKKTRKVATKAEKAEKDELEKDIYKIADWFWSHKNDKSFKTTLGNDVKSWQQTFRLIKNDERGLDYFAKLMQAAGYKKAEEKPFSSKVTIIKKQQPEAAKDFENVNDRTFKAILPFFTSWAKENGIKLSQEAINTFKEQVFKTIVYHNTMGILHGDR